MFFNNLVSEDERFYINRLTSVTINGKELVRYDYDHFGNLIHRELADGDLLVIVLRPEVRGQSTL